MHHHNELDYNQVTYSTHHLLVKDLHLKTFWDLLEGRLKSFYFTASIENFMELLLIYS